MKRVAILAALLAGCTVGPDYQRPEIAVPGSYTEAGQAGAMSDAELAVWWGRFNDPLLSTLIARALAQNLDIEAAAARIHEARALERAAGAAASPQLAGEASATRQRISENAIPVPPGAGSGGPGGGSFGIAGSEFNSFRVGFDAAWEIDLFGRNRRERDAASARSGAAVWNRRDTQVSVAAEVARVYFRLSGARERYRNAEAESARAIRLERLFAARAAGGLINSEEVRRLQSERSLAASLLPIIRAEIDTETHALGVLVGAGPEAFTSGLHPPIAAPESVTIPPGLPSDLLRRRPDIRAAERELAAATADIGVAVAELYPRISLTAAPALVSTALGSLLEWGSRAFTAGAALDWPLFDGGRRRANVEVRNARQEQALISYRKTILTALQDVEDALSRVEGDRGRLDQLKGALIAARAAEELADTRHRGGLVTYSDVLVAQGRRLSLEEQLIEARSALAQDIVALAKALGGGWPEAGQ